MKLSKYTQDRDNNFNLIRIVAALAVLITHSFALAIGSGDAEPFRTPLGITMGAIAVDVFFITSGFLVTASLFQRQSATEFIWARFLRIFPALVLMLSLTVFVLGIFFTSMPSAVYLADSQTHIYLLKSLTLIAGVGANLPGVFDGNPYKNAVNGSLWTMPYEVRMYAILLMVWLTLRLTKSMRFFETGIIVAAGIAGFCVLVLHFHPTTGALFAQLFFMFFSGSAFYVLKERIALSRMVFWIFLVAMAISTQASKHVFFVIYTLTIAYTLFYLAYVPSGWVRKYNKFGDYSYGLYIYAFPVQQSIAALIPGISVLPMVLMSFIISLSLAVFSWHFLEKRALGLKSLYVGHTRRILKYGRTTAPTQST